MSTLSQKAISANLKPARSRLAIGKIFLFQLAMVYVMDWWFPYQGDGSSVRFWPHVFRAIFVLQLLGYLVVHVRQALKLPIARFQFLWFSILTLRFALGGNFDVQNFLYMSYYAYWILVMWTAYCLVQDGCLEARSAVITAELMNVLFMLRMALYGLWGVWLGDTGNLSDQVGTIANSAYPLLWFTLMLTLDTTVPLAKPITLFSVVAIVLTMKRGAFLALLLGAMAYGIVYAYTNRQNRGVQKVIKFAVVATLVIGLTVWSRASQLAERWSEIQDPNGGGSGRGEFWMIIALHWLSADPITKLIGFGAHSTFDLTGQFWLAEIPAHNDWLQMLHEFGVIGVLALAGVFWAFAKSIPRLVRDCPKMAPVYCAALAGAFCTTVFDLFSYNTETGFFSVLVAIPLGLSAKVRSANMAKKPLSSQTAVVRTR